MQIQNLATIRQKYHAFPTALRPDLSTAMPNETFILYGTALDQQKLIAFQQKCGQNLFCFDAWNVAHNTVVLLKGEWREDFPRAAHELGLDIALLDFEAKLSEKGLLVMDMDSTAIQIECIDEIAKLAGTGGLVSAITESAMRGELDFEQSLRRRVETLKGAPESILQQVRSNLPLMSGLEETIRTLKQHGWKIAIASGGFTYFADYLKDLLQLDFAVSNQFDIENGKLTGFVKGDVVDAQYKAAVLQRLRDKYGIAPQNSIAIGDGANDLAMMNAAGLGVAFHAKPKVQQQAQVVVNFADLTALLCLLTANDRIS